jgi:putative PIN family toxin of toxin-antitoxin system
MSRTDKFIVDTNTLISSLLIRDSTSFKAMEKARSKGSLIFSGDTFSEFAFVLLRKKFDRYFSQEERLQIIGKMSIEGVFETVISTRQESRDPKDDMFLNLAIDGNASCIITGDKDLLVLHPFHNIPIVSPFDFLNNF